MVLSLKFYMEPEKLILSGVCLQFITENHPLENGHSKLGNHHVQVNHLKLLVENIQQSGDSWMYPYQRTPMENP